MLVKSEVRGDLKYLMVDWSPIPQTHCPDHSVDYLFQTDFHACDVHLQPDGQIQGSGLNLGLIVVSQKLVSVR